MLGELIHQAIPTAIALTITQSINYPLLRSISKEHITIIVKANNKGRLNRPFAFQGYGEKRSLLNMLQLQPKVDRSDSCLVQMLFP